MRKFVFHTVFAVSMILIITVGGFAQQPAAQATPVAIKIEAASFDAFIGQYEDAVNLGGLMFSFSNAFIPYTLTDD